MSSRKDEDKRLCSLKSHRWCFDPWRCRCVTLKLPHEFVSYIFCGSYRKYIHIYIYTDIYIYIYIKSSPHMIRNTSGSWVLVRFIRNDKKHGAGFSQNEAPFFLKIRGWHDPSLDPIISLHRKVWNNHFESIWKNYGSFYFGRLLWILGGCFLGTPETIYGSFVLGGRFLMTVEVWTLAAGACALGKLGTLSLQAAQQTATWEKKTKSQRYVRMWLMEI